jgi:uncharacterized RDD family membrane protein YckC
VESKAEMAKQAQSTALGTLDLTLLLDPAGLGHVSTVELASSAEKIAREVPIVVGTLLFAQQQLRMINDPSRLVAVEEIEESCRAGRAGRLVRPTPPANARPVATYRVELLASSGFRINVEERLAGILSDVAGGLTTGSLPAELLTTLREPYRTFYLEMLEAAIAYWRERRPSLIESTWVWTAALRRLDQLVRGGVESLGEPQSCAACGAVRPSGFACLHCGTAPGESRATTAATTGSGGAVASAPANVGASNGAEAARSPNEQASGATVATQVAAPVPAPATLATEVGTATPSGTEPPDERRTERTILPAQDRPPQIAPADETQEQPLAGLLPRFLALIVDLVIGGVLGLFGGFGLTAVLVALNTFGPADDPRQFFSAAVTVLFALYFILGWTGGETFGMLIFRTQVVQGESRKRCGFFRAVARAFGYTVLLAIGLVVFFIGNQIDNHILFFIPTGTPADDAIRVIVGLISLYVIWLGSGQRILSDPMRRTWADRLGKTLVVVRSKSA